MKENNKRYALILAGGKGSRLWPISTTNKPKQYLNLYSNNIMINETIKRIESIFEYDNILKWPMKVGQVFYAVLG